MKTISEKFLSKKIKRENLKISLKTLKMFKNCESQEEWFYTPFDFWKMLELYEECLEKLIKGSDNK